MTRGWSVAMLAVVAAACSNTPPTVDAPSYDVLITNARIGTMFAYVRDYAAADSALRATLEKLGVADDDLRSEEFFGY